MKRSLYIKNFISTAAIVLLSFSVLGGTFSALSYRILLGERHEAMTSSAKETIRYVTAQSKRSGGDLGSFEVRMAISMIARASGFDILIADTEGVVVSCSDDEPLCTHIGKVINGDILASLLAGKEFSASDFSEVYGEKRYAAGSAMSTEDGWGRYTLGFLFISADTSQLSGVWRSFLSIFMLIALSVMCITFIISLLTTKRQAEPINEMAQAARKFARGDFSVRVEDTDREDEIGSLTVAFNAMADSMERSETRRRELIANVSHELKTPMTVIAGFADGILDGTIPPEKEEQYLTVISSETRRLSRLVRSLLDAAQLNEEDAAAKAISSFDVAELLRVTLVGMIPKLEAKGLEVVPELPEEPVFVTGEKDALTQVAYNLIDNAVKFARPGSELKIALWKQGERAFVSVEDEGDTIPEGEMPMIFDRFYKTDRSRGLDKDGVGLGLYIVKTILDRHNEDIYVTSEDGVTKFTFTLKITPPEAAPRRAKEKPEARDAD